MPAPLRRSLHDLKNNKHHTTPVDGSRIVKSTISSTYDFDQLVNDYLLHVHQTTGERLQKNHFYIFLAENYFKEIKFVPEDYDYFETLKKKDGDQ